MDRSCSDSGASTFGTLNGGTCQNQGACQETRGGVIHGGKRAHRAILGILCSALWPTCVASAQCVLPQVQPTTGYLATPAARYAQALTYADHQCLNEAKALLTEAAAGLAGQSGTRAATLRNLVAAATDYVAALEALGRGERTAALATLQRIVERGTNVVSLRAAMTLGATLVREAGDDTWKTIEEPLSELSRRGYPEAESLLIERLAHTKGLAAAITNVEKRLAEDLDLQWALTLDVVLIELYTRAGRLVDANLLLSSVERNAAETLLDLRVRKRLLEAGLAVSNALIKQGRTEFIGQRDAYGRALLELKRFIS